MENCQGEIEKHFGMPKTVGQDMLADINNLVNALQEDEMQN